MGYPTYTQRKASWKTTTSGVIALLVLLLNAAVAMLDEDPNTNPDFNAISVAAVAVGTMFARDVDVTSEQAGAK